MYFNFANSTTCHVGTILNQFSWIFFMNQKEICEMRKICNPQKTCTYTLACFHLISYCYPVKQAYWHTDIIS